MRAFGSCGRPRAGAGVNITFIPLSLFSWGHERPDLSPLVSQEARAMRVQDAAKVALWRCGGGGELTVNTRSLPSPCSTSPCPPAPQGLAPPPHLPTSRVGRGPKRSMRIPSGRVVALSTKEPMVKPRLSISSWGSQLGHRSCASWVALVVFSAEEGEGRAQHMTAGAAGHRREWPGIRGPALKSHASDLLPTRWGRGSRDGSDQYVTPGLPDTQSEASASSNELTDTTVFTKL